MRVPILRGGGREHAIGWKLARRFGLDTLISPPGNPGPTRLGHSLAG